MASDPEVTLESTDPIVNEAAKRFKRCADWEAMARERFIDDLKFAEADPDNGYQWPQAIKRNRDVEKKPCLTINIVRQHNLQIRNEAKQNKSSIRVKATGNGATKKSADLIAALIRRIEYQSNAQFAYSHAAKYQVDCGVGWFRLVTQYVDNDSFDQEILILPIRDPLSVYMDPDCKQQDQSDARFGFVFDLVPKDQFEDAYPEYTSQEPLQPLGVLAGDSDLATRNHVRVVEYFRKVEKDDLLVSFIDPGTGLRKQLKKSLMPTEVYAGLKGSSMTKMRSIKDERIEWKLIAGEKVIDETEWAGSYIPLIRMIGEECIVDGVLDRKGHTRAMKDTQRMFNYNASSQVEFVALQSKTPYIAAAKAIENYESMWNTANQANHSVLIYNDQDEEYPDRIIAPPVRQAPPVSAPGFQEGMDTAFNQMMMASGQWQNQMGMMGNERTGAAINARQAQSDTSVYHFQDNYANALRYAGKQIIDLIPKVYDTKRMMQLAEENGEEFELELDPQAPQLLQEQLADDGEVVRRVMNPMMGKYDVEADVGAAYGTRREETVQALTLLLTQAPALTGIIGDLLLNAMDFKEAQEAAMRLRRMIPPQALGKGPSPNEQRLQAQLQGSQIALAKALDKYAKDGLKLAGKAQMRDIDAYKAHTDRIKALGDMLQQDPAVLAELLGELGKDTVGETLRPIIQANMKAIGEQGSEEGVGGEPGLQSAGSSMPPGARQAQDGEWYMTDPHRQGRYLRIAPLVQEHKPRGIEANV